MRAPGPADISQRAGTAIVVGSLLLHAAAVLCLVWQMRAGDNRAAIPATPPPMFAFLFRPESAMLKPTESAATIARAPMRATPMPTPQPPITRIAAASEATPPATAAEQRVEAPPVTAAHAAEPEPAPATHAAEVRAAPPEALVVARADHDQCPPASYPVLLRDQGIEGVVTLRVRVDALGRAAEVQLLQPSGWRLFDEAALQRVRACRFVPARRAGEAVASWVEFPVRFALAG